MNNITSSIKSFKSQPDVKNEILNNFFNGLMIDGIQVQVSFLRDGSSNSIKWSTEFNVIIKLPHSSLTFMGDNNTDVIIFPPIENNLFGYKNLISDCKVIKITENNMEHIRKYIYSMYAVYDLSNVEFDK